jgi:hypothetical protein
MVGRTCLAGPYGDHATAVDRAEVWSQMGRRLRLNRIAKEKMQTEAIAGTEIIE